MLRILKFLCKALTAFSLAGFVALLFIRPPLPAKNKLELSKMYHEPTQQEMSPTTEVKEIKGYKYQIEKVAKYKITGLVVEQYSSDHWLDLTHKNDPANTRDLCIIWGSNLDPNIYNSVKFDHGEFTCYVSWSNQDSLFNMNALSNNHLIPESISVADKIKGVRVGDQITITGYLSNYKVWDKDGKQAGERRTSTVREDTGNGACEVLYTTDIEVVKSSAYWYFLLKDLSPFVFLISAFLNLVLIAF